jgi:hypothetical protein
VALQEALGGINLRVWAELGRAHMPLGRALGLPVGAVVDLDRAADAPVDLYVNGTRFACGHLIVTDDGEWAVALDELDSDGLPILELAGSLRPAASELVESEPLGLDSEPDNPIDDERLAPGQADITEAELAESEEDASDVEAAEPSEQDEAGAQTPDAVQTEGAVT